MELKFAVNRRRRHRSHGAQPFALALLLAILLFGCSKSPENLEPLAADAVILAFGDSLTHGTGAGDGEDYPSQLAELSGLTVINAGVPGETSDRGLARLPELLETHRPDLVILWHGGNDILQNRNLANTEQNLREMITHIRDLGADVLLISVPTKSLFLGTEALYPRIAEEEKVALLDDVLASILRDSDLKADSVHPNGDGYRKISEAIYTIIQ
jgi:lysophospholipase L1-like esterase